MAEINCSQGFDTIILIQRGLPFERRLPWILLAETYQDIKQHLVNNLRVSVVVKITLIFVRSNKTGGGDININKKLMRGQDGMSFLFPPTFCLWRSCATSSGELMSTESWSRGLNFRYQSNLKVNLDRVFTLCQQILSVLRDNRGENHDFVTWSWLSDKKYDLLIKEV